MNRFRIFRALGVCLLALAVASVAPRADSASQPLPFAQDWSATALLSTNDNWNAVPGIVGYRGDGLVATGSDPRNFVADGSAVVDVNVNQANPSTFSTGGVTEFEGALAGVNGNPVIALAGSGTARLPHIVISLNTSGMSNVTVAYNLRDIEASVDNAVTPVALQYRVGSTGNYTNVAAAFVADATQGPSLSGLVTPVSVVLPAAAAGQPLVQLRISTTDASGNDEWIGIDDISVTGSVVPQPTPPTGIGSASPSNVAPGADTLLTVAVNKGQNPDSTGLAVAADLTAIGGAAQQPFYDNGTHGDAAAGDQTFSFTSTVHVQTTPGAKSIGATITDAEVRSSTAAIALNVFVPITSVTISQVYGGGGNSGATYTHDFIELYNRSASPVDVSTWSVQYASANGTSWAATPLSGTIQPGTYYLVQEAAGSGGSVALPAPDATGGIAMSGTNGKIALVASQSSLSGACASGPLVVDFVGYGTANCFEGAGAAPGLGNTTAALRVDGGATDTNSNVADFTESAASPKNSTGQPPTGAGSATPSSLDSGDSTLLTVTVTAGAFPASSGITVTGDLSNLGSGAPAAQPFFDDGTNGDASAGDLIFSFTTTVTGTQGSKPITATVSDTQGRTTQTTFSVTIQPPPIAINTIQGAGSRSDYAGQLVTTIGIITAVRPGSYYIQTPDSQDDGDPNTSEGLLVFRTPAGLSVGDMVRVSGTVVEFVPSADPQSPSITELANNSVATIISSGHTLPGAASLLSSFTVPSGNFEQLERFEGMRIRADVTAISGTSSFRRTEAEESAATSVSNGDFFAVITGVARPMREKGLEPGQTMPASPCCIPQFDGNPEKLRVDSDGQKGALKIEIVAGQTIAGMTGVLDYGFRSYTIVPDPQAWTPAGRGDALAVPMPTANEFTVAAFNMERFFDTADDFGTDDPVLTPAAFAGRLAKASLAIRHVLRTPDILGVEEVENLSTLQTLADKINADAVADGQPNPQYEAHLFEGNDIGGIDSGVLVKTSRVDVISVIQVGKTATYTEPNGDISTLNDRPPVVLEAAIRAEGAMPYAVTVIVNHLRSLSGIDGSDGARIRTKRRAQAEFLASYIQGRQAANPDERIVSVGDYNAFNVNDGYVDLIRTITGDPTPADNVLLASGDLVEPNLVSLGDTIGADQYSFLFDGNAQTLDHILVNQAAFRRFSRFAFARTNADFPESLRSDATRPERLSDHDVPVAYFTLPGAPVVTLTGASTMTVEAATPFVDPGAVAVDEELGSWNVDGAGTVDVNVVGSYTLTYTASNGFLSTTVTRTVNVVDTTAPLLVLAGDASMTIEAGSAWTDPGATAADTRAGNLTSAIVVGGTVNTAIVGTYTVTYTVTDGYNSATATRTVSVVDTTAPALSGIGVTPSTIKVPNHKMVDITLAYAVTDVTGAPVCSVTVTSNEAINGPGDGNTSVDWQVLDSTHVRVRAERSGQGSGRIYSITVTCTDASGNRGYGTGHVTVLK